MNRRRFLALLAAITAKPKALIAPLPTPPPVEPIVTIISRFGDFYPGVVSYNVQFMACVPPTATERLRTYLTGRDGVIGISSGAKGRLDEV